VATARASETARTTADTGWVLFAASMIGLIGVLNVCYGIAAIDDSRVYRGDTQYVIGELATWGWFLVVVGAVQFGAGIAIWAGSPVARWIGIASAAVNALVQMFILPAFPAWAIAVFAIDVLILYGLIAHWRRP
jgi:hypothetical protein